VKRQIVIGDVHGSFDALERLLDKVRFDPTEDRLRFVGDLVNRGGQSLEVLRFVYGLGEGAETVLGNHDLALLRYAHQKPRQRKKNPEFNAIVKADDGQDLLDWLRTRPLFWKNRTHGLAVVHAGIDPRWGVAATEARAQELAHALATEPKAFFEHMFGNRPRRWRPHQPHFKRLRAITNVFTRMRFCDADGRLELDAKGNPNKPPKGFAPWWVHRHPEWQDWTVVFGHWSTLGLMVKKRVICLDSGCAWGGALTALISDPKKEEHEIVSVPASD